MSESQQKRPTFLTVLCILSFIGGAWGLIGGLISWSAYGNPTSQEAAGLAFLGLDAAAMATSTLIVALTNVITLLGAFMMFKLQKKGFFIYTVGQIAAVVVPLVVLGGAFMGMGLLAVAMGALFPIIFIILYAVNLKHMS